jgi:hypothetical protein
VVKSKGDRLFLRYLRYIRITDRHIFLCIAFIFSLSYSCVSYGEIVTVLWNPSREPNVAGYKIYYGNSSRNYDHVVDVGNFTNYELYLPSKETCYIALTAYDAVGNESDASAEVIVEQGVRVEIVSAFIGLNSRREERFRPGDSILYQITYRVVAQPGKPYKVKGIVKAFGQRLVSRQTAYPGYYYRMILRDTIPDTAGGTYTIKYILNLRKKGQILGKDRTKSRIYVIE